MREGEMQNISLSIVATGSAMLALVSLLTIGNADAADPAKGSGELQVVAQVDLSRYLGKWYEIAHIPVFFQKGCAGGTTATYTLIKEGTVGVVNQCCTSDGQKKVARGRAWVVDKKTNAKLKVSFVSFLGFYLFAGDYWIIDLGPNYEYAVIGHPGRSIGWILSRTPNLPPDVLKGIAERLTAQGYDFSQFKMTNQTDYKCSSE
jgi:apolipoprotein D and lipocalin family protein